MGICRCKVKSVPSKIAYDVSQHRLNHDSTERDACCTAVADSIDGQHTTQNSKSSKHQTACCGQPAMPIRRHTSSTERSNLCAFTELVPRSRAGTSAAVDQCFAERVAGASRCGGIQQLATSCTAEAGQLLEARQGVAGGPAGCV